jgi:hypothetical protein
MRVKMLRWPDSQSQIVRRNKPAATSEYRFLDGGGGSPVIEEHSGAAIAAPE